MERGCSFNNLVVYSTCVDGLCKEGRADEALELLGAITSKGILPNNVTYAAMIHGLCCQGRVEEALELLRVIRSKGILPNNVTYSTLIYGLCCQGKCDEARALLEEQVINGIMPNAYSYASLIQGLSVCSQWIEEMVYRGIKPGLYTFTVLIDGLGKEGKIDEAQCIFDVMVSKGRLWIHTAGKVPDAETIEAMEAFYREIYSVDGVNDVKFPQHYPFSRLLGVVVRMA
ncbi:hypothetical protein MLD38_037143 [Melastoma candidum]|uniref:Uncharacterized protein n=1 Tax=Melastoma candidum TaxID=119954 RepID=A0ACB9LMW8_9MYRT|nr:hypothetical protein MLD38_037143 [Melastoma candidum]